MERFRLPEKQRLKLITILEKACGLPLPRKNLRLGDIQFFLRVHDTKNRFDFQIRWGAKSVFLIRDHPHHTGDVTAEELSVIMHSKKEKIREKLVRYGIEQVNNIVAMELPIHIQKLMPDLPVYDLFVNLCRRRKNEQTEWPAISVFVSWTDEKGEFQEFVFPLQFDKKTAHFILDYPQIANALRDYRERVF